MITEIDRNIVMVQHFNNFWAYISSPYSLQTSQNSFLFPESQLLNLFIEKNRHLQSVNRCYPFKFTIKRLPLFISFHFNGILLLRYKFRYIFIRLCPSRRGLSYPGNFCGLVLLYISIYCTRLLRKIYSFPKYLSLSSDIHQKINRRMSSSER